MNGEDQDKERREASKRAVLAWTETFGTEPDAVRGALLELVDALARLHDAADAYTGECTNEEVQEEYEAATEEELERALEQADNALWSIRQAEKVCPECGSFLERDGTCWHCTTEEQITPRKEE